jgi:RNA polymerase sigma-70 factor (ECF subfamily)
MGEDPLASPEELIRRVYGYVAYRIGDAEAEDVTSEVFERAVRYRASFDPARGPAAAWLFGIARTCLANHANGRHEHAGQPDDVPAPGDLEAEVTDAVTVRAAVSRLCLRERELVALRYGGGLSAREIGELLGERTNTIEVALHRAVVRLRDDLAVGG